MASPAPDQGKMPMTEDDRGNRLATLDYMHTMLGQLRAMAEAQRCDMLAYLIEMASQEAGDIVRGEKSRSAAGKRRTRAN